MRKTTMTERGAVTGVVLSILLGIALTWKAAQEGAGLQPSADVPHPWLHGVAVNGLYAAVFIVPLSTVFGRWLGDYLAWRRKLHNDSTPATKDGV